MITIGCIFCYVPRCLLDSEIFGRESVGEWSEKKSGVRGVSRMRAVTAESGFHTVCLGW